MAATNDPDVQWSAEKTDAFLDKFTAAVEALLTKEES